MPGKRKDWLKKAKKEEAAKKEPVVQAPVAPKPNKRRTGLDRVETDSEKKKKEHGWKIGQLRQHNVDMNPGVREERKRLRPARIRTAKDPTPEEMVKEHEKLRMQQQQQAALEHVAMQKKTRQDAPEAQVIHQSPLIVDGIPIQQIPQPKSKVAAFAPPPEFVDEPGVSSEAPSLPEPAPEPEVEKEPEPETEESYEMPPAASAPPAPPMIMEEPEEPPFGSA